MKTFRFLLIAVICILAGGRGIALGQCVPPPSGMVAWWPLDETSSPANDLAGVNNVGTWMNNPTPVSGKVAGALSFDNDYVEVQDHSELNFGEGDLTIDAWVKRDSASTNSPPSVIIDKRDPISGIGYSLAVSYGRLTFLMSGTNYATTTYPVPADDQWHHVAVTVNRVTNIVQFYCDGILLDALLFTSPPGNLNNTNSFWIGKGQLAGNQPWLGCIDELELFNRALDSTEVQAIFIADSLGKCKPDTCLIDTLVLNTGYNHNDGTIYSDGTFDNYWIVIADPEASTTEPRPANVTGWQSGWSTALNSVANWINYHPVAENLNEVSFDFRFRFCLDINFQNVEINMRMLVDDEADIFVNTNPAGSTPPQPYPCGDCNHLNIRTFLINDQNFFHSGCNEIIIRVRNVHGVKTGLIIAGSIKATSGLRKISPVCCPCTGPTGSINGFKWNDLNGNGDWQTSEPKLPNWTINLSNGQSVLTDAWGYYFFNSLPAGTYTVSETNQTGFTQTFPSIGTHTVNLGYNQTVNNINFGNKRNDRNHYKTWRIQPLNFEDTVFVHDQFMQYSYAIILDRIDFLSNPVKKVFQNDTFNIISPNDHLTWYRAESLAPLKTFHVDYVNQFESTSVWIDTLKYLLVPTRKLPHDQPENLDHYIGYKIETVRWWVAQQLQLQDQFDSIPEFISGFWPTYFLTPARKNNEPVYDTTTHYIAYEINPKRFTPQTRQTTDQFGPHTMQIDTSKFLLVPTKKIAFRECIDPGDVNGDGKVSVSDVIYLINYLFKGGPLPIPELLVGDVNGDGKVTVSDVVYLINYLFKGGPPLGC